ncbi:hypothetical protein OIY81_711 [Cryptosporidium canis]|uniref:Uncharacterized protein n=1 Tax=Cryptosporidium canis TaxID=195482 RepID=A0ABQ8PBN9_9CRYT|nr:hypothetical protein OIY81_711 [Cryptosporidium canis]KAJ1615304.1 hypothetical protein OJ252_254 [Cryptosporidium canis]
MENLRNATCIPHISGKLIFGYILDLKSFYECEIKWNLLSDSEKSNFIEISRGILNDTLLGLTPLENWRNTGKLEFSQRKLFYFANYPSNMYLFPHLAENEILQRCCIKLNSLRSEKRIFEVIDKLIKRLDRYISFEE